MLSSRGIYRRVSDPFSALRTKHLEETISENPKNVAFDDGSLSAKKVCGEKL
jgi:hypothetical protein